MMAMYLWVALSLLFLFSNMVNTINIDDQCTETTLAPDQASSGYPQAVDFTETNCTVSSNNIPCFERCLKPNITLEPGMDAYAECTVPKNDNKEFNRANIVYFPPNSSQCVRFQSETGRSWHQVDKHIHFRRQSETVEILIVNVVAEHQNLMIVCLPTNTNGTVPEGCMDGSRATLFVETEADSENTDSPSTPTDNSVTDTDSPSTPTDNRVTDTDSTSTTDNSTGIATIVPVVLFVIGLWTIYCNL